MAAGDDGGDKPKPRSAEDLLLMLRGEEYELARDLFSGEVILTFTGDPDRPSFLVGSEDLVHEVVRRYMRARVVVTDAGRIPKVPSKDALQRLVMALRAMAVDAPVYEFQRRAIDLVVNGKMERHIDLCLGRYDWRTVRVTERGFSVTERPSRESPRDTRVRLYRDDDMKPMALPETSRAKRDEAFRVFRRRCSGLSDEDFVLLWFYMLAVWRTRDPTPLLNPVGEFGTLKSSVAALVKTIVDPSVAVLRDMPRKPDDLRAVLRSAHLVVLDNTSDVSQEQSDILCQHVNGITAGGRKFWVEAKHYNAAMRGAVIITSIAPVVEKADLASRTLVLHFARNEEVLKDGYKPRHLLERHDAAIRSGVVAMLLLWTANGLRNQRMQFKGAGRMADFEWGSRAAAFGLPDRFLEMVFGRSGVTDDDVAELFRKKRGEVQSEAAAGDILPEIIAGLARPEREGELVPWSPQPPRRIPLAKLWIDLAATPALRLPGSGFPANASQLGKRLRERSVLDALEQRGIGVEFGKTGHHWVALSSQPPAGASAEPPVWPDPPQPEPECPGCGGAGWWCSNEHHEAWQCSGCEPMPAVVTGLRYWPPLLRH